MQDFHFTVYSDGQTHSVTVSAWDLDDAIEAAKDEAFDNLGVTPTAITLDRKTVWTAKGID